ncbi:type II toxin-antitoxin system HicB family antitoxin [Empedobacter falsenii]
MEVAIIMEKSTTGYSAFSKELPGLVTVGETIDEVKENFKEVIELQADYLKDKGKANEANELLNATLTFYLDLETFFDYYSMFNKSKLAEYLGINSSLLRRLSTKNNIELSEKKAAQIEKGLHKLGNDLKEIRFA